MNTGLPDTDAGGGRGRLRRLAWVSHSVLVEPEELLTDSREWVAMVSSRLGHDLLHHRQVSRFLSRAMLECSRRDAVALIAIHSAIEPLASRAAELFRVPVLRLSVASDKLRSDEHADLRLRDGEDRPLDRDQVIIMLADRVDVLHARRGGKMAQYAEQRVLQLQDTSTRVAVSPSESDVARSLIACGAIGWHLSGPSLAANAGGKSSGDGASHGDDASNVCAALAERAKGRQPLLEPEQWLIHCTRTASEPWPNETANQFRDEVLLDEHGEPTRDSFESLKRIVRGGKLVASCRASDRRFPVVCFSAVPLEELLARRKYRSHLHRWDYEPYGVAVRTSVASAVGIRPVVYGEAGQRCDLAAGDQHLFQAKGKTFDWTVEREWRSLGDVDLSQMSRDDVRVFTLTVEQAEVLQRFCGWQVFAVEAGF